MSASRNSARPGKAGDAAYILDEQIGFILRKVSQRHAAIFAERIGNDLTPTQWAALAKLSEKGPCSQNLLGRRTAMDVATIKGVIDRLVKRGYAETRADPKDGRLLMVALTAAGETAVEQARVNAHAITKATLSPLTDAEGATLLSFLKRLC